MRTYRGLLGIVLAVMTTAAMIAVGSATHAGAEPLAAVPPDFVLTPNAPPIVKDIASTTVGGDRVDSPENCRGTYGVFCDVYRVKLNLSTKAGAQNYLIATLDYADTKPPTIFALVLAEQPAGSPNLDLSVYKSPTGSLSPTTVGGQNLDNPERVAFVATQPEYDFVIENKLGVSEGYTLKFYLSDEIFSKPFESLDDLINQVNNTAPPPPADSPTAAPFDSSSLPDYNLNEPLALAPIAVDSSLNNLPTKAQDTFIPQVFGGPKQNAVAVARPPSGISLFLALGVFPILVAVGGVVWLRRRRQALI